MTDLNRYYIISQANADGLWEFPKKFDFILSNSWRGKNNDTLYNTKLFSDIRQNTG